LSGIFPGEAGYRMFLVDAPRGEAAAVSAALTRGLRDRGLELTPAAERLNAFNAVQNTFLDTFQVLGGLGLLLGSAGLGVVVLRNVLERRGELALLAAVGLRRAPCSSWWWRSTRCCRRWVCRSASWPPFWPSCRSCFRPRPKYPSSLAATLGLVFLSGCSGRGPPRAWLLRGELLPALRNE
jgi:hypothetical protein